MVKNLNIFMLVAIFFVFIFSVRPVFADYNKVEGMSLEDAQKQVEAMQRMQGIDPNSLNRGAIEKYYTRGMGKEEKKKYYEYKNQQQQDGKDNKYKYSLKKKETEKKDAKEKKKRKYRTVRKHKEKSIQHRNKIEYFKRKKHRNSKKSVAIKRLSVVRELR